MCLISVSQCPFLCPDFQNWGSRPPPDLAKLAEPQRALPIFRKQILRMLMMVNMWLTCGHYMVNDG